MADSVHSSEFIYWVKATLGLQITKDCLCRVIEKKMPEFVEMLSNDQEYHLRTRFLPKKILTAGRVKYRNASRDEENWKFQSRCNLCCRMFAIILKHHTNKRHWSINWQCHHPTEQDSAPVWWIIAKIFMTGNNKSCTGPQEADPLALFSLIMNCELFSSLSSNIQEVIDVRETLMHLSTNTITEQEMKDAMDKMKSLLKHDMVQETSTMALNDIEKVEQKPLFLPKLSKENRKLVVKALQSKASSIEYGIKQQLSSGRSTIDLERELQKTKDEINTFYVDEIAKMNETNANLEREIQRLQKLSDANEQVQCKINEKKTLTGEIKQLKCIRDIYKDESAKRQQIEKENVNLRRKLSDADEKVERKSKESEALTEKIKQLKHIRDLECAKRQQLEKDNVQLRKKLSDEEDKVLHYRNMMEKSTEEGKKMLAVSFKHGTIENEVSGAESGGTVG